jgi:hypothetical protein
MSLFYQIEDGIVTESIFPGSLAQLQEKIYIDNISEPAKIPL